jgi:hypothetical protein
MRNDSKQDSLAAVKKLTAAGTLERDEEIKKYLFSEAPQSGLSSLFGLSAYKLARRVVSRVKREREII